MRRRLFISFVALLVIGLVTVGMLIPERWAKFFCEAYVVGWLVTLPLYLWLQIRYRYGWKDVVIMFALSPASWVSMWFGMLIVTVRGRRRPRGFSHLR